AIRVDAERHRVATADAESDGDPAPVEVDLVAGRPLDGHVVDAASGRPIAGAVVTVEFDEPYAVDPTDAEGRFHVPGVPEDVGVTLRAGATRHVSGAVAVRVAAGKPSPAGVVLRLEPGGAV